MGKIKNWSKISEKPDFIEYRHNSGIILSIIKTHRNKLINRVKNSIWMIDINTGRDIISVGNSYGYNKKQAKAYATRYMRSHPKG